MAVTAITPVKAGFNGAGANIAFTAASAAADGWTVPFTARDHKLLILAQNTDAVNAEVITINKGAGIGGVADREISIAKGETVAITLDSSAFKASGLVKIIPASTDTKLAAIEL